MLKRLYIDNVRCLQGFEFKPGQVSVLVGPNGGGKSTVFEVLKALQGFLGGAGTPVREYFGLASLTRWDRRPTQTIELEVQSAERRSYVYQLQVHHDFGRREAFVEERLTLDGRDLYRFTNGDVQLFGDLPTASARTTFPADRRRSFLSILEPRPDNTLITAFKGWLAGMWLFKLRPDLIVPNTTEESTSITHDGRNFASWFRTLQQELPSALEGVVRDVKPIIPGLAGIRLKKLGQDVKALAIDCSIGEKHFELFLDDLSDGQRVLLVLYTILHALADSASLMLFDEPDNYVSQAEIQPWLSALRDRIVSGNHGTLLILSHHPEVIDYLAPDQIVQIWRDGGPSRQREFEPVRENGLPASVQLLLRSSDG